jgi:molybdopterin synthase sulfur carrier subunit
MKVKIYATLRQIVGGPSVEVNAGNGSTMGQVLQELIALHPALRPKIWDEHGELLRQIHVFLNGRDVRYLNGLETTIRESDTLAIFPPVGGG